MTLTLLHVQVILVLVAYYKQLHVERIYTIHLCSYTEYISKPFLVLLWCHLLPQQKPTVCCFHPSPIQTKKYYFCFPGTRLFQIRCTSVYPKHTSPCPLGNTNIRVHTHSYTHAKKKVWLLKEHLLIRQD